MLINSDQTRRTGIDMSDFSQVTPKPIHFSASKVSSPAHAHKSVSELSTAELAQVLAERLTIAPDDWHRLKANRKARASEQAAVALVYLLKDNPEEAIARLQQAVGWLDRSISAPPCPTHGDRKVARENSAQSMI
jgi:Family of unknown function (DUF6439)